MRLLRSLLAVPIVLATGLLAQASEVRDNAKLFSRDAVTKAEAELARIERETNVPVTIETVDSLNGKNIDEAMRDIGKSERIKGLFVLIAVKEKKNDAGASREYDPYFRKVHYQDAYKGFLPGFKKGDFDLGLAEGVEGIGSTLRVVKTEAGGTITPKTVNAPAQPQRRGPVIPPVVAQRRSSGIMTLIWIVVGIFAVMFVFRLIGAMMGGGYRGGYGGAPGGMGGPGYGPGYGGGGGGGFFSSLFGGIGGAMAGNWLYDQFSGRHRHYDDGGYTQYGGGEAPPADNTGGEWGGTAGDGGGSWGGGDNSGGGGGDWGGGGGGDGGGGGGGDWGGGGGGGDWGGGGGGDGGSW